MDGASKQSGAQGGGIGARVGSTIKIFKSTASGGLEAGEIERNFGDLYPKFTAEEAVVEASSCLYCYDAPCLTACPTKINIPKFIKQIETGDSDSAAATILSENILGGTCARACPTEELCEEVCVVNERDGAPVKIGRLQRFAVDGLMEKRRAHPFTRAPQAGIRFAVIGAGPAGLAFAHRFAMLGHDVVIFEKRERSGGLNEYGLAAYKMADDFAQREVEFLLGVGGVEIRCGQGLGEGLTLAQLQNEFDGVFIAIGLSRARLLGIPGAGLNGVEDAIDFIDRIRQAPKKSDLSIGANVVVIGGGNTAIDAALQARCLGADNVTLAYRRGSNEMGATDWEQQLATANGVNILNWASPAVILGEDRVEGVKFDFVTGVDGSLVRTGKSVLAPADNVFVAIGQEMITAGLDGLAVERGKITVNEEYQTSLPGVYAGGDCTAVGSDLTVQAVEDGKQAAIAADRQIRMSHEMAAQ